MIVNLLWTKNLKAYLEQQSLMNTIHLTGFLSKLNICLNYLWKVGVSKCKAIGDHLGNFCWDTINRYVPYLLAFSSLCIVFVLFFLLYEEVFTIFIFISSIIFKIKSVTFTYALVKTVTF